LLRHAIASRVRRLDKIQIKLDPGLLSRSGLGEVERTRIELTVTGTSGALTSFLGRTQRQHAISPQNFVCDLLAEQVHIGKMHDPIDSRSGPDRYVSLLHDVPLALHVITRVLPLAISRDPSERRRCSVDFDAGRAIFQEQSNHAHRLTSSAKQPYNATP